MKYKEDHAIPITILYINDVNNVSGFANFEWKTQNGGETGIQKEGIQGTS